MGSGVRRWSKGSVSLCLLAVLAACQPIERLPQEGRGESVFYPAQDASLVIANRTSIPRLLRVRPLRTSVQLDCPISSPEKTFTREAFDPAIAWVLEPQRALPLVRSNQPCTAFLVDADDLPLSLVYWRADQYPTMALPSEVAGQDDPEHFIELREGADGLGLSHPTVYPPPSAVEEEAAAGCEVPPPEVSVEWSTPAPTGQWKLKDLSSSPDGCHAFFFDVIAPFYVCAPVVPPFAPGETVSITPLVVTQGAAIRIRGATRTMTVSRGRNVTGLPFDTGIATTALDGCGRSPIACGGAIRPAEVLFNDGGALHAGEQTTFANGMLVALVRAEITQLVDTACTPGRAVGAPYVEAVVVASEGEE
jgi:hypothetical protein